MKRILVGALTSALLLLFFPLASNAAITPGTKCAKVGAKQVYKGKIYICIKLGKKLYWDNGVVVKATPTPTPIVTVTATPTPTPMVSLNPFADDANKAAAATAPGLGKLCAVGKDCSIGSTGPGGGIVFYDAGSQQPWGRYLEVAPNGWSGALADPENNWCNITDVSLSSRVTDIALKESLGVVIGKGKSNTKLMLAYCSEGAAIVATNYKGGGKSDWFLPSQDELNELCKYNRSQVTGNSLVKCDVNGLRRGGYEQFYWSSSEKSTGSAYYEDFIIGYMSDYYKGSKMHVRPVRSF